MSAFPASVDALTNAELESTDAEGFVRRFPLPDGMTAYRATFEDGLAVIVCRTSLDGPMDAAYWERVRAEVEA